MSEVRFHELTRKVTQSIRGKPLDKALQFYLNENIDPNSALFKELKAVCRQGVDEKWLANREQQGIRFGRVVKPSEQTAGYSVDVVDMRNIEGPRHTHPKGEIDMIMPMDKTAKFDGVGEGWLVLEPGSAHRPTVTQGRAIILYLLPDGEIDFS